MRLICIAFLAGTLAVPAQAALQCNYYDDMVAEAVMIMQIAPTDVIPPEGGGQGNCTVRGEIMRSFLGPHPVGTMIETVIRCEAPLPPGAESDIEVGATMWWDYEALRDAPVIELHIAAEGGPAGYGSGVAILPAPTGAPARRPACGE